MNLLPRHEHAVIPIDKFVKYSLNYEKDFDKATAFNLALGYNLDNAHNLINNIKDNLQKFECREKGDAGFGMRYEVVMHLTGENGKIAEIITAWIDDKSSGEIRLTNAYVNKKKGGKND